ncbi:MAG: hypothetical protein IPL61_24310 [Myxococcales bacterium]|nr:hypothetical protein [Myxococcales bacterium]
MFTTARLSLLLATLAFTTAGCALDQTSSTDRAIIETPCADGTECPAGFECEIEVEHGVTTSYCQADDDSDGACPAGYEAEIEHGQLYCQPHGGGGGGSGSGGGDDDGGTGAGTAGAACTTDADCAAGLECEVEVEHGQTVSTCQPHGGV